MSYRGYCHDEYEHRRKAERDARYWRKDYEYYDRYSDDPCKQVYTETYDSEIRSQIRREQEREEEQAEMRRMERRQLEREAEENFAYYAEEQYPEEQYPEPEYPDPTPSDTPSTEQED